MKKRTKILLGVLLVLIIAIGVLCVWQWNNISAARYALTLDQETVENRIIENEAELGKVMEEYGLTQFTLSEEEISSVTVGDKSADELAKQLVASQTATPDKAEDAHATDVPEESTPAVSAPAEPSYEDLIREQIAKMYILRSTFVARLDEIVNQAIYDYTVAEDFTYEGRVNAVSGHLDAVTVLEAECDTEVQKVVSELRRLLKESGQDDSLAKKVEETYKDEKSLKKSYYLQKLTGN